MEYMPGGSLSDLIVKYKFGVPIIQIKSLLRQILKGLAYLHDHNIIHRDLKVFFSDFIWLACQYSS